MSSPAAPVPTLHRQMKPKPLRILLISWYFPPFNAIGGLRVGKFARYLREQGHDVRVLCGSPPDIAQTDPVEIPLDHVLRTGWIDIRNPPRMVQHFLQLSRRKLFPSRPPSPLPLEETNALRSGPAPVMHRSRLGQCLHRASQLYVNLLAMPDGMIGWTPFAVAVGRRLGRHWRPDLIYGSGPPFSNFVVADRLARYFNIPWVAEFRDRWVDDPYFNGWPAWQMRRMAALERRLLTNAAALVTVSEPWSDFYRGKFAKPVVTAANGFDPRDQEDCPVGPPLSDHLVILYTGVVYAGKRDPSPLFQAITLLGPRRDQIRVVFLGTNPAHVRPYAAYYGLDDQVEIRAPVSHRDSLQMQRRADLLLLLQWHSPQDQGHCPAKLFEYVGARRPIIGIGLETGVAAEIIRDRQLGIFTNDPDLLAARLAVWLDQKERLGQIPDNPWQTRLGFDRDAQFAKILPLMQDVIDGRRTGKM